MNRRRINLIALLGCVLSFVLMLIWPRTGTDAGYYISVGRHALNGFLPLSDFHSAYTPLVSYLIAPLTVLGSQTARAMMLLHVALWTAMAALLWRMSRDPSQAFTALVMWAVLGVSTGTFSGFWLENFSVFFILAAVYSTYKAPESSLSWILAGFSIGLATLSKQYGILGLPFLFLFAYAEGTLRIRRALIAFFTTALVGLVFVALTVHGLHDVKRLIIELSGGGYLEHISGTRTLRAYAFEGLPVLLALVPGLIWMANAPARARWIAFAGSAVMSLPLLVRHYEHYYVYLVAWVAVMIARHARTAPKWLPYAFVGASFLVNLQVSARTYRYVSKTQAEIRLAEALADKDLGGVHTHGRGHLHWRLPLEMGCPDLGFDFLSTAGAIDAIERCCRCTTDSIVANCKTRDQWAPLGIDREETVIDGVCIFWLEPRECSPDLATCPYAANR